MTYLTEKAATQQTGLERPLITIEFYPDVNPFETEYTYEHPRFVFGNRVILKNEYPQTEYVVVGLKIIESKTSSGMLLAQPCWKYEITNGEVSYQKEESALFRAKSPSSDPTCKGCQHFEDYREPAFFEIEGEKIANNNRGKGWCNCFNNQSRTYHHMTGDCIENGSLVTLEDATLPEVIELDRDGYPMYETARNGYFKRDFVTHLDEPF